jgi:Asp-tRNA(Asn)/Glu-tRNA(Gln) amidotransferase A subunit family amidase
MPCDADHSLYRNAGPTAQAPLNTVIVQANTCSFDVSGDPAFTVPCGRVNGLPVGLMLVWRRFEEVTPIGLTRTIKASGDWKLRRDERGKSGAGDATLHNLQLSRISR